jgi:hypothetical protein
MIEQDDVEQIAFGRKSFIQHLNEGLNTQFQRTSPQ